MISRPATGLGLAALLLPALQLLLGCQPVHPPGQLVVATKSTLDSVDPVDVTSFAGTQLLSAIGDPLYSSDARGQLQPRLATALPRISADGLTARIPLRRDVRFHDGSRFDAAAMVFSLERFRALAKLSYLLDDHSMAFTGDALLVRGCGRCDFQQGDAHTLYRSISEQILSLPDSCLLYPGHDYTGRMVTSVAEEKAFNARLGGAATERDFVGHMQNMKLPHPHRIAVALPGNLRSGKPREPAAAGSWAPLSHSYAGLPELTAAWVADHSAQLTLVDVRSAEEFNGPDGRIPGSLLLPLPELESRAREIPGDRPLVVVCHAGSRSALATQQLLQAGFRQVANLRGGIHGWEGEGYPIERA